MIRTSDENTPPINNAFEFNPRNQLENNCKMIRSAFKIVSRIEKSKPRKVINIKSISKKELGKYNIRYINDGSLVDKLFEFKDVKYQCKKTYI